jgi:H+/gluconate symporter-like permease
MDLNTISTIGIVVSLAFIVILALRGWHIIVIAPLAAVIAALFSNLNVLETLTGPYMKGFTNYAGKFYLIFLLGTIFGKFMEDSGAARSIATAIIKLIDGGGNSLRVLLAFSIVCIALIIFLFSKLTDTKKDIDLPQILVPYVDLEFGVFLLFPIERLYK